MFEIAQQRAKSRIARWSDSLQYLPYLTPEQQCNYYAKHLEEHFYDISIAYICSYLIPLDKEEREAYFKSKFLKYLAPFEGSNSIDKLGYDAHRRALLYLYSLKEAANNSLLYSSTPK